MRYVISAHGCYRKEEKVHLKGMRLEFHSAENEYLEYSKAYLKTFCKKSMNKRNKAYKPVRKVDDYYYQMELGRKTKDTFESYIYCCTTKQMIYDFRYGDLLLSDALDLIRLHADLENKGTWIFVSMLTCNTICDPKPVKTIYNAQPKTKFEKTPPAEAMPRYMPKVRPSAEAKPKANPRAAEEIAEPKIKPKPNSRDFGVVLHRSSSFTEANLRPANRNWVGTRNESLRTRKNNMWTVPNSKGPINHILKRGNSVKHRRTGKITVIETKKQLKELRHDDDYVFFPNLKIGDEVLYKSELWLIIDEHTDTGVNHYVIQHRRSGEIITADTRELVKVGF